MDPSFYADAGTTTPARREPDPARRSAAVLLDTFRRDPPGAWSDNRQVQAQKFRGVPYVAIRAIMDLFGSCTTQVVRRKKNRNKSTFGPGGAVAKALPTAGAQSRDEEYTPFTDLGHPLPRLIARPNGSETFGELGAKLILQNRLTGVGPLWKVPNAKGQPVELWPLKTPATYPLYAFSAQYPEGAWRVTPFSPSGWAGAVGRIGSSGAILPGEEVARFSDPHPYIDWDGFSPLTATAHQLDILEAIDESRWSAMNNGLQLDAVLMIPGGDEAVMSRMSAAMTEKAAGSRNARKFLALGTPTGGSPGDKPNLQTFGQSPRDMDYSAGWDQMVKFCLAVFGVPQSVAGLASSSSYSEFYAAIRQFHHRQGQFIRRVAEWFTKELAWPWCAFPDEFRIQIDLPTIDDPDLLQSRLGSDTKRLTVNETRALRNFPPVKGGDVPEDVYVEWVKSKVMPEPEPAPQPGPGGDSPAAEPGAGGPEAGDVPGPENPQAEGSRPPAAKKALAELTGSDGGFLVPDGTAPAKRKKKRRAVSRYLNRLLKSL